jgi:hypothetical protein
MSQWGTRDRVETTTLANAINNSNVITAITSQPFTAANGFLPGYGLMINANTSGIVYNQNTYTIVSVTSGNTLVLDTVYTGANTVVANIAIQQSPKDIRSLGLGTLSTNSAVAISVSRANTTVTKRNVFGVDRTEVGIAGNKANGFSQPGWTHYKTWTTTQGMVRHRAEVLVASSKNFNANATGVLNQTDAFDGGTGNNTILPNS